MDRVRFGRALGRGARLAARTAYEAVDAATAASPESRPQPERSSAQPNRSPAQSNRPSSQQAPVARPGTEPLRGPGTRTLNVSDAVQAAGKVHGSVQQAKRSVFAPVKRASHALTLEMTGSFFALFALSFSVAAWRARAGIQHRTDIAHFWVYIVLALLFAYFAGSNFVRAQRL